MVIHDVKDGPILQDYGQEPSMSSKYDSEDEGRGGPLDIFNLTRELIFGTQVKNHI